MRSYYAKSWSRRYEKNAIMIEEDEDKVEIKCELLTDMVYVKVNPPWDRKDPNCNIYGQIAVKLGQSDDPITLFSRQREDPALVVLGDYYRSNLYLPDGVDSPPPLEPVSKTNPIRITLKLHEKKSSGEDELIAEVTDFLYAAENDDDDVVGRCSYFEIPTEEFGFSFEVCYAVMLGARAEIEVKIKEEGGSIAPAKIAVIQNLLDCANCCCGQTFRTLYNGCGDVCVRDKLQLERNVFGLPVDRDQYLTVVICPTIPSTLPPNVPVFLDKDAVNDHLVVDFPIKRVTKSSFMTNKELTHTKDVPGTPFSVSVRILPLPG